MAGSPRDRFRRFACAIWPPLPRRNTAGWCPGPRPPEPSTMGFDETRSTRWERHAIRPRFRCSKSSAWTRASWYEAPRDGRRARSSQDLTDSPSEPHARPLRRRAEAGSPPEPWAGGAGVRRAGAAGDDPLWHLPGGEAGDAGNSPADAAHLSIHLERDSVRRPPAGNAGRPRSPFASDAESMASGAAGGPLEPGPLFLRPVQIDAGPRRASLRAHAAGCVL